MGWPQPDTGRPPSSIRSFILWQIVLPITIVAGRSLLLLRTTALMSKRLVAMLSSAFTILSVTTTNRDSQGWSLRTIYWRTFKILSSAEFVDPHSTRTRHKSRFPMYISSSASLFKLSRPSLDKQLQNIGNSKGKIMHLLLGLSGYLVVGMKIITFFIFYEFIAP